MIEQTGRAQPIACGAAWYALAILTLVNVCYFMDRSILAVVMEPMRHEFGLNDTQLGLLYGLTYVAAFAVASIPLGWMVDRHNRRNLLSGIIVVWSVATAVCGFAQNYSALVLARMSVGVAEAGGPPACLSLVSDYFSERKRATAIAIWTTGATFGFALSFAAGGYVAQHYGWRSAFFVAGIPGLLLSLIILTTLREPQRRIPSPSASDNAAPIRPRDALAQMAHRRDIAPLLAAMVFHSITTSGLAGFMASFMARNFGFTTSKAGLLVGLSMGLCGGAGAFLTGLLADNRANAGSRYRPEMLAFVSSGAALLSVLAGLALVSAPVAALAVPALFALGFTINAPVGTSHALLVTLLPSNMRGTGIATISALSSLFGSGLGNLLVGGLSDLYGGPDSLRWAMGTILLLTALSATLFVHAGSNIRRMSSI